MNKGNVLVTGGTGFVGSHLIELLLQQGYQVITTTILNESLSYFTQAKLGEHTTVVPMDVRNQAGILHLVTRFNIQFILHLAAQPLVDVALADPAYTLDTNIMGTVAVLEAARKIKSVRGVIVASSDKAYGKLSKGKYQETDRLQGDHPYEVSKSAADLICTSYIKTYLLPVVITRFGNIYGEGDLNTSRLIPGIIEAVYHHHPLELRSDGTFVRDYLYVKDVARGYLLLMQNFQVVSGQAFNFGSHETYTVKEVVALAEKALQTQISVKFMKSAVNEIPAQSLSYTKIQKTLGWKPQTNLSQALPPLLQWYQDRQTA